MSLVSAFKSAAKNINEHVIKSGVAFTVPNLGAEIAYGLSSMHNEHMSRYIVLAFAAQAALTSAHKMKRVSLAFIAAAGAVTAASGLAVEDTIKEICQNADQWRDALQNYDWRDIIPGEALAGVSFVKGVIDKWRGNAVSAAFSYAMAAPALYWAALQDAAPGSEINPYLVTSAGLFLTSALFLPFISDKAENSSVPIPAPTK